MKYSIFYLIKGKAKIYHNSLVKQISKKFGTHDLSKKLPPHLTLKTPFISKNVNEIENILGDLCKIHHKTKFLLKGFDNFRGEVIFMKVIPSKDMLKMKSNLISKLKDVSGITFSEYELKPATFHATLAYSNSKDTFKKIWGFLKNKKPEYKIKFDGITIMKKSGNKWESYKDFKFK